ncbi:hypothetical protein DHEL01_v200329 [Diaporthe helianthi]|uniref:Protein kinase domain-containing protein n=1 Tax=Diaporthe helianthi TaxID=158607 RepID=A0A2P5IFK5_DIAHE|nr:hypothetical protein DHEL01_v200329 [Diaporthe helianthi]
MVTAKKNFTFIKILGAGGSGVVVLLRWTPASNAAQSVGYNVAMKYSARLDEYGEVIWDDIANEKDIMQNLVRAPHITQPFFFRDKTPDLPGFSWRLRPRRALRQAIVTAENLDATNRALFMEFAKMGDLRNLMQKLGGADNHFPPEVLWRIFDCLVKACKAMEYPPFLRTPGFRNGLPLQEDIPVAQGPPGAQPTAQPGYLGKVHFDLDPQNIFLAGYDAPDHTQVPKFQNGTNLIVDQIRGLQIPPTLGRYGTDGRLHQAQNMLCLVLLTHPDFPPVAGRMLSQEPPGNGPVPAQDQRWTYADRLIEGSQEAQEYRARFTPLLCDTIARCLMHRQEHRPDLVELQRIITNALRDPPIRLADDIQRFFGSDAPPPVPIYAPYIGVDIGRLDPFDPYPGHRYLDDTVPDDSPDSPPRRRVRRRVNHDDQSYVP